MINFVTFTNNIQYLKTHLTLKWLYMYFELFKDIKNDDINMTILKKIIYKFIYECIKKIYYSFSFIVTFSKPNKPSKHYF